MDSGNSSNQQQLYCPTPIMAPPSVAASPPIMSAGGVMSSIHQQHHPPPSISPHPVAYYGHHSSGQSHYPTPSPTPPPPMHHQQYYGQSYYGSHQQAQQQQSQQPQHLMSNAHMSMNTAATVSPSVQQGQHAHLMAHGSYHHSQTQHHQQWAPSHHQQQSHHYYHQPTHHSNQQQQQVQPQQHGYPPPPHSPYPYAQPHPSPTPPPHSPHQQQHIQTPQSQQQHPPPVPASPNPVQMHQAPQQSQSHALMNLSRFVNQQTPSPCPSPRASPSLASHHQQVSQMGPQSPSPFNSHMEHHSAMNGHTSAGPSSPVMSPPPLPVHVSQQPMSPSATMPVQVSQHHHFSAPSPLPYTINGSGRIERPSSSNRMDVSFDNHEMTDIRGGLTPDNTTREHDMLSIFPNLAAGISCTKDSENQNKMVSTKSGNEQDIRVSSSMCDKNDTINIDSADCETVKNTISSTNDAHASPSKFDFYTEVMESGNIIPTDVPGSNGSGASMSSYSVSESSRTTTSPQPRPIGSPTNTGNGHQMMPVRLQNMQKGARTKASMKKLMQEHQTSTPNGQILEASSDSMTVSAKEVDLEEIFPDTINKEMKGKVKSPKKKRSPTLSSTNVSESNEESACDLTGNSTPAGTDVLVRPGYTKAGKKIGRPRKDSVPSGTTKPKSRRSNKSTPKKSKKASTNSTVAAIEGHSHDAEEASTEPSSVNDTLDTLIHVPTEQIIPKSKSVKSKTSRKRSSKVLNETANTTSAVSEPESSQTMYDLITSSPMAEDVLSTVAAGEGTVLYNEGKRRKKSKANTSSTANPNEVEVGFNDSSVTSSAISEQEAESVALRFVQAPPPPPSPTKGKSKRRKSAGTPKESRARKTAKERKSNSSRKQSPVKMKEVEPSPERGDLPRLRSRSPKQRESPPLRISSPRAAKERSTTPASNTNLPVTQKSRSSKEKEVLNTSTPLSSPTLRSPRKSPEKDKAKNSGGKSKQKVFEVPQVTEELLSPPPLKRTRQMSKESSESQEFQKGRRKTGSTETRMSIDSDLSPSRGVKRTSRRKSGSVSLSDNAMSSPSFNQSISSIANSESSISLVTLDESAISNAHFTNISIQEPPQSPVHVNTVSPNVSRRRKSKTGSRSRAKSRKIILPPEEPISYQTDLVEAAENNVTAPSTENTPSASFITVKTKRKRTAPKKRKKSITQIQEPVLAVDNDLNLSLANDPLHNTEEATPTPTKPAATKGSRKRKPKGKKVQNQVETSTPPAVLNIPTPIAATSPKKVTKSKAARRPKQSRKSKQPIEEALDLLPEPHLDGSEMSHSDENKSLSLSPVNLPQDLSPSRRRRPSVVTPNTQSSAKSSTPGNDLSSIIKPALSSPNIGFSPKQQRRESRSLSRDYDVSVVLTDIAQSLTTGELAGVSSGTGRSPFHSPSSTSSSHFNADLSIRSQVIANTSNVKPLAITEANVESLGKRKRQRHKSNSPSEERPPTKKKIKLQNKIELQERKANLEAEIAQALLELQTSTNSISPSPTKFISNLDVSDMQASRKKPAKQRKRKSSTSVRRRSSATSGSGLVKQENVLASPDNLDGSILHASLSTPFKTGKRKPVKARRTSKGKAKLKAVSLFPDEIDDANVNTETAGGSQSLRIAIQVQGTVKVTKTATIPAANSLDINELVTVTTPVVDEKQKSTGLTKSGKKKRDRTRTKVKSVESPDITAFTPSAGTSPSVDTSKSKKKRPKAKVVNDVKLESEYQGIASPMKFTELEEQVSSKQQVKTKAQRKPKSLTSSRKSAKMMPEVTASTSDDISASTSELFPYQPDVKPMKIPTVFAKSTSIFEDKSGKDDDNQKKKALDGPSLKVLGGLAKFYRGEEEEEVDLDPKIPKEKAPVQTDNAVPWICSFCHLGPHAQKLGDLFGPYFANLPSIYGNPSSKRETWMHGDCALWAGRLLLIGTYLRRLEETLSDADKETCTVCGKTGATIGCLRRGCREAVHFPCAVRKFWKMNEQNFHSYCPQHIT